MEVRSHPHSPARYVLCRYGRTGRAGPITRPGVPAESECVVVCKQVKQCAYDGWVEELD
jgi:hypothetical protein